MSLKRSHGSAFREVLEDRHAENIGSPDGSQDLNDLAILIREDQEAQTKKIRRIERTVDQHINDHAMLLGLVNSLVTDMDMLSRRVELLERRVVEDPEPASPHSVAGAWDREALSGEVGEVDSPIVIDWSPPPVSGGVMVESPMPM